MALKIKGKKVLAKCVSDLVERKHLKGIVWETGLTQNIPEFFQPPRVQPTLKHMGFIL